jgi:hypothetical protein
MPASDAASTETAAMIGDTITVIRARGRRLAKLIEPDGTIVGYDSARTFDMTEQPVADLDTLRALLDRLLCRPDCAVVRGAIADPARSSGVRRLLHDDAKTGERATLHEAPRRWCALDIDGLERPKTIAASDLWGCAIVAIQRLPEVFRGAAVIVQASASHGIKPGCRLRLWFWLSRPTAGAELRFWLRRVPVDPSIFRAAQVIYTAAPIFALGRPDPLPARLADMPGAAVVAVPAPDALRPSPSPPPRLLSQPGDPGATRYAFAALRNAAVRIATAREPNRHNTILREGRGLARFATAGLLAEHDIRRVVAAAAEQAGKEAAEAEAAITWAFAHPSAAPLPQGVTDGR